MFIANLTTFEEVVQKEEQNNVMKEKLASIQKNKTQDLVDLPKGKKVKGVKWVFKTKFHANGNVEKHKLVLWQKDIHNNKEGNMKIHAFLLLVLKQ